MLDINRCFMRFSDRAERIDSHQITDTFVSVGPLLDVLESKNNQLVYGRRGTGKTHALRYFMDVRRKSGDIAIYVDFQNIGSNQSIYDDKSLPLSERATRLLIDVCSAVHGGLLDVFTAPGDRWNLSIVAPLLDKFVEAISDVRVVGHVETENVDTAASTVVGRLGADASLAETGPKVGVSIGAEESASASYQARVRRQGAEQSSVNFGYFGQAVRELADSLAPSRLWILLDEWSTIPPELQPLVADLLRRTLFPVPNITVKIAAIEHRSMFKVDRPDGTYIGFELGADIAPAINLDDYLVFDNDPTRAEEFFKNLIGNHATYIAKELGIEAEKSPDRVIAKAFTQHNVFLEFVVASEGVPRDAMHILATAAQRANEASISMPVLRASALLFFQADKYSAIQSNPENRRLLDWIRDEVIGGRSTRAFLLPVETEDELIDRLFDRRALHIKSRSMSSAHRPGERFIVYKLDYGCYADLMNTDRAPTGMLIAGESDLVVDFEVPEDDKRSYRRAVLDLSDFYEQQRQMQSS